MCRARCSVAARWSACTGQTSDLSGAPFPFCEKSESFAALGACFDPLRSKQIPFSRLLAEILEITALLLLLWACSVLYSQVGALVDFWRRRPASTINEGHSEVDNAGAYEEVPMQRLSETPTENGDGDGDEGPAAEAVPEDDEPPSCRICKDEEGPFIRPCRCSGSAAYVHPECLQKWVETKTQSTEGEEGELQLTCEVCLEPYDVQVGRNFVCDKERLCSPESWSEYCNCLLLLFLLPLIFVAMWLSCNAETEEALMRGEGLCREEGHWTIVAIGVLLCLTFIATLQKVILRWYYLNNDVVITGAPVTL